MIQKTTRGNLFRRFSAVTIIAVYLLILVGGIVRSTGSGMGCPDWPKCFGSWIPPTTADQLPDDYKTIYTQQRIEKNKKLAGYLEVLGLDQLAYQIRHDPSIREEEDFNAVKTWTEYINRLIGVAIGILIFGTFVCSNRYWKTDKTIVVLSFIAFVLVGVQGWIGSVVVSTNLLQWIITVHMLLALAIVCLLIYVYYRSARTVLRFEIEDNRKLVRVMAVCLAASLIQVVLGTQVREAIDLLARELPRTVWIDNLGMVFYVHRSYSIIILGLHLYLIFLLLVKRKVRGEVGIPAKVLLIIVGAEVISGVLMAYFGVPAFIQPLHLLLGTMLIGVQYYLLLLLGNRNLKLRVAE